MLQEYEKTFIRDAGEDLQKYAHRAAKEAGWWTDRKTGADLTQTFNIAEKLCLIHSEISEAMEGARKGLMDDHLPHREMIEVELADAVIRIGDLAGALGLDLGGAIAEKMVYNETRADHKPANRDAEGGKAF
jgi:NTP pyrophosphatase (non-canonical NTP hydrolase)